MSSPLHIFFRVDASVQIGTGHVMRCLTLAEELHKQGAAVSFISRELPGNLFDLIASKHYDLYPLSVPPQFARTTPKDLYEQWLGSDWQTDAKETSEVLKKQSRPVDWLVVDHYVLDEAWESSLRSSVSKIFVLDDLANRSHDCDGILDQNFYDQLEARYDALTPPSCKKFLGPRYALLRSEFFEARKDLRKRTGELRRILVFFGGIDLTNETEKAIQAIQTFEISDLKVDVVLGSNNPHRISIEKQCRADLRFTLHCPAGNMAELMARADLAIGAGGTTTWERCFLGLPTLAVILAENQAELVFTLAREEALINLGWSSQATPFRIAEAIREMSRSREKMLKMTKKGIELMGDVENARRKVVRFLTQKL